MDLEYETTPAVPKLIRFVGVYAADGGLRGELSYLVGSRLGRTHCALCEITHGALSESKKWKTCRAAMPVPFDTFHRNDQPAAVQEASGGEAPVVVAETSEGYRLLLSPPELDACLGSVEALGEALEEAVAGAGIRWPSVVTSMTEVPGAATP